MTFRSCAVSTGSSIIMIGGHNNDSTESLNIMLQMTKVETSFWNWKKKTKLEVYYFQGGDWTFGPLMLESRRDHACLYLEFERSRGVLVTGGQGANDEVGFSFVNLQLDDILGSRLCGVLWPWDAAVGGGGFDAGGEDGARDQPHLRHPHGHRGRQRRPVHLLHGAVRQERREHRRPVSKGMEHQQSGRNWSWSSHLFSIQVLTSPRYEHAVASIPASKVFLPFLNLYLIWFGFICYLSQMKSCKDEEEGGLWSYRGHSSTRGKCFWTKDKRTKKRGRTRTHKQDFFAVDQSRVSFVNLPKPQTGVPSTRNNSFVITALTVLSICILLAVIFFALYAKLSKNVIVPASSSECQQEPGQQGRTIPVEEVYENVEPTCYYQTVEAGNSEIRTNLTNVEIWMFKNYIWMF